MSDISRTNFPGDTRAITIKYYSETTEALAKVYPRFCKIEQTDKMEQAYSTVTNMGPLQLKAEGSAKAHDTAQEKDYLLVTPLTYALEFSVSLEYRQDAKNLKYWEKKGREFANSDNEAREYAAIQPLVNAFDDAFVWADGVNLCDLSHPLGVSGLTQKNTLTVASDLNWPALKQIIIDAQRMKNNRGLPMQVGLRGLIISPENQLEAAMLLKNTMYPHSAERDINPINYYKYLQEEPIISTRLTNTKAYFVLTDVKDGLIFLERTGLQYKEWDDGPTDDIHYSVSTRFTCFPLDFRCVFGVPGV